MLIRLYVGQPSDDAERGDLQRKEVVFQVKKKNKTGEASRGREAGADGN